MSNNKKALLPTIIPITSTAINRLPLSFVLIYLLILTACGEASSKLELYSSQGLSVQIPTKASKISDINIRTEGAAKLIIVYDMFSTIEIVAMIEALPPLSPYAASGLFLNQSDIEPQDVIYGKFEPVKLTSNIKGNGSTVTEYKGHLQSVAVTYPTGEKLFFNTHHFQFVRQGIVYTAIFDIEQESRPKLEPLITQVLDSLLYNPPIQN